MRTLRNLRNPIDLSETRNPGPRWALFMAVLGLLAGLLTATQLAAASAAAALPPPPQPAMNCDKPWVIINAYGTAEYVKEGVTTPYGSVGVNDTYVRAVKKELTAQGVPASDISARNLPYPASAIDWNLPWPPFLGDNPGPDDYWTSMRKGRDELVREIQFYASCPSRPTLVLTGYSQGGQVIKNALAASDVVGDQVRSAAVGAAITIGDASRYNGQIGMAQNGQMLTLRPDYQPGETTVDRGGLMQRVPVPSVFAGMLGDGRYFDVCRIDDLVCNKPGRPGQGNWLLEFAQSIDDGTTNPPHIAYRDNARADGNPVIERQNREGARVAAQVAKRAVAAAVAQRNIVHPPPNPPGPPPGTTAVDMWASNVNVRTAPTRDADVTHRFPGPTTVYVACQKRGESVTDGGVTNDVWSYLPLQHGWISNLYLRGPAWIPGVPECAGAPTPPKQGLYKCSIGGNPNDWCARVTAIDPGSFLGLQNAPDYEHGRNPYYHGHNGDQLIVNCWTEGAVDADGTGNRYWFFADTGGALSGGYVNDHYLTTGLYADWSKVISHC
ncbi:cutinase family protein [Streptomyces sp. NPDC002730]|uniref:cutinase family protein n=1 Tax=Streptomyces sp. NPDC002730 TaxID=3364662 RepID=UPI00367D02FD